ncbi:rhodanese-like domain-containing protein [Anaeromicrobium sediminis]|uniref:Rhodanese domain-containing protein n=1 Tax=Anaeromicrobium sediminis TaxID=1478221 RepID=A0A267MF21_9FIRM|nr:rhodanese-like domain-containing protein [Anaeromicrobium sediminis]PAB58057.1 hypothetical protein CCE28_17120 [Anaeromicrobium sediminis]
MLKIFVLKRRNVYIALLVLLVLVGGLIFLMARSGSNETFSDTMKFTYKKISPEQTKVLLDKNPNAIVFDIREEDEYIQGHIPSATHLSYKELKVQMEYFNKDRIYVIYGPTAKKAAKVADVMTSKGFPKVYILNGGIDKWPYDLE